MSKYRKYTKEILEPIVKQSVSIRDVLRALDLKYTGGNHSHITKTIDHFGIDRSHFLGQGSNKGKPSPQKQHVEHYLNNSNFIGSSKLRNKLLEYKYFPYQCQLCGLTTWLDNQISLELHHIDCNPHNNYLSNLQILCPNCHKYTHDQLSKNNKTLLISDTSKISNNSKALSIKHQKTIKCPKCDNFMNIRSKLCKKCSHTNQRKVKRPDILQLKQELEQSNYCAVARKYGVSDNAIRKWINGSDKI